MAHEKKCPHCQQWTPWQRQLHDRCAHCGHRLLTAAGSEETQFPQTRPRELPSFLIVKEQDRGFFLALRKLGLVAHMAYLTIMGFIMMLVAAVVH